MNLLTQGARASTPPSSTTRLGSPLTKQSVFQSCVQRRSTTAERWSRDRSEECPSSFEQIKQPFPTPLETPERLLTPLGEVVHGNVAVTPTKAVKRASKCLRALVKGHINLIPLHLDGRPS